MIEGTPTSGGEVIDELGTTRSQLLGDRTVEQRDHHADPGPEMLDEERVAKGYDVAADSPPCPTHTPAFLLRS